MLRVSKFSRCSKSFYKRKLLYFLKSWVYDIFADVYMTVLLKGNI